MNDSSLPNEHLQGYAENNIPNLLTLVDLHNPGGWGKLGFGISRMMLDIKHNK